MILADLHGVTSRVRRVKPLTGREIERNRKLQDSPTTVMGQHHGQVRVIFYVRDDVNLKVKPLARGDKDLPSVSFEIGVGH